MTKEGKCTSTRFSRVVDSDVVGLWKVQSFPGEHSRNPCFWRQMSQVAFSLRYFSTSNDYALQRCLWLSELGEREWGTVCPWHPVGRRQCLVASVVSDFLWPCGLQPARLLHPWDSPARILEWAAMPFSRGSSQPRDWTHVSCIAGGFFTIWATREAQEY